MRNYGEIPERSFVTVLAVDTVGSTKHIAGHDPDEAQAFFDDIMEHLSAIIEDAGGMLASFHGDGGFGIFGWPNSLEAHADLACEAAWNIQHPHAPFSSSLGAEKKTVQFRVGIHSGLVGFRQLQLEVGSNFDLVGETIHYAASLEKQCEPGGIVISQKTVDLCEHELSLSLFEQDGAAGSERTRIHKLLENPQRANNSEARQNYPFPIIGRTTERQYLHEQLNPLAEKLPVIAIIGEPGIGKSRLATSAANHWHDSNHRIFSFKGDIKQGRSPFALFRHLFEIALKTEDYSGSVLDKLLQAGASEETAQQVATMLDEDDPGPQQGRSILTQRQVARILVQSFAQLMGAENTLIFVEDLHLVDLESRECLALLQQLDSCNHIGALVTGRPEAYEAAVQLSDDILMLEAMPQEDLSELAERLRKSQGLSVAVSDNLLKQADGVPFVLEQLIYSLQLGDSEDNAIPQSIESLIHGRLNSLSGEAKSVLQALSLIGEQSDIVFIAELVGVDGNDLSEILAESSAIGLINPLRGQSVRFRHAIIADACATTVPKATKQKVHQRAIDVFSVLYSDLDQHYEQLAFHAENAGDDENAIEYYWLAGLRARKRSATGSLLLIFKQALSCMNRVGAPANDRYVDFVLMAYASLIQVGEFTEMKSHLPKALELVKQQSNVGKICAALCN